MNSEKFLLYPSLWCICTLTDPDHSVKYKLCYCTLPYCWGVCSFESFLLLLRPPYSLWSLFLKFAHHYFDKDWISVDTWLLSCYVLSFFHSMALLEEGRDFKKWVLVGDTQITEYMNSDEEWDPGLVCSLSHLLLFLLSSLYSSLSSNLTPWHSLYQFPQSNKANKFWNKDIEDYKQK